MAKIVIIAGTEARADVDDAAKMLRGNGHDVDIEDPVPKNVLHIVLGLLGPNAYGFGPGYAYSPGPDADAADGDNKDEETAVEDETTGGGDKDSVKATDDMDGIDDVSVPGDDDFNFEGIDVDGEPIKVTRIDADHSILIVTELTSGAKTSYKLNESSFSFWPARPKDPWQRVEVGRSRWHSSLEVQIQLGEQQELKAGRDLYHILEASEVMRVMHRLQMIAKNPISVHDGIAINHDINSMIKKGWTPDEIFSMLRNLEEVNPDLDEGKALANMEKVRNQVKARLAAKE